MPGVSRFNELNEYINSGYTKEKGVEKSVSQIVQLP